MYKREGLILDRASLEKTRSLLEHFIISSSWTNSTFHEEKIGNGPSVDHACEVVEFSSAKKAIDRDLGGLLSSVSKPEVDVVYAVHYSNTNGLSKLEDNILAHEISEYFSKTEQYQMKRQLTFISQEEPAIIYHSINNPRTSLAGSGLVHIALHSPHHLSSTTSQAN